MKGKVTALELDGGCVYTIATPERLLNASRTGESL